MFAEDNEESLIQSLNEKVSFASNESNPNYRFKESIKKNYPNLNWIDLPQDTLLWAKKLIG